MGFYLRLQVTCAVGLVVQVVMLVVQFAQYKTVVNVDLQSSEYDILPALTICLPIYLSVSKVAEKYSNVSEIIEAHQQYKSALAKITQQSIIHEFLNELNSLYNKFVSFVENQDLSVDELSKLTVPYKQPNTRGSILFHVFVLGSEIAEDRQFVKDVDQKPIESVMLGHDLYKMKIKCFTFFSQLNKEYRDWKFRPSAIDIRVSCGYREVELI